MEAFESKMLKVNLGKTNMVIIGCISKISYVTYVMHV